jgi:SAM-dependent methyltransferase
MRDHGYDAGLFELIAELEEKSFWFRARNDLIVWALLTYFPHARNLVEIGCGSGFVLHAIHRARPGLALTGIEPFEEGLEKAAERVPDASLLQLDARDLRFERQFDVAAAFDVLEHIDTDEAVLQRMYGALQPGGGALITVPQHPRLWSAFDEVSHHQRRYTRKDLVTKATRVGFRVRRVTSFVSLLLPAVWLMRTGRSRARAGDLTRYRTSRTLDAALGTVMVAERSLIRAGLSFPVGASLLLVADRPENR